MNTTYGTHNQTHHRFATRPVRRNTNHHVGRQTSERNDGRPLDAEYTPGSFNRNNPAGVYSKRDLMKAFAGRRGCCSSQNHHQTRAPQQPIQPGGPGGPFPRPNREQVVNKTLTNTFNQLGKQFPQGRNAVDRLAGDESRSTLVDLLGKNDLVGAVQDLEKKGPVTVLAPSNEAFANLAKNQPELFGKLTDPRNKEALQQVLLYHVGAGATDFAQGGTFDSLLDKDAAKFSGNPFYGQFQNGDQTIRTGPASVSQNGSIVIPVDQILIPPGFDPSQLV